MVAMTDTIGKVGDLESSSGGDDWGGGSAASSSDSEGALGGMRGDIWYNRTWSMRNFTTSWKIVFTSSDQQHDFTKKQRE